MKYLKNILLCTVIIGASYFMYFKYFTATFKEEIVLSEEFEENKKKPVDSGGIIILHSNSLIYEKLSLGNFKMTSVNILPDPESPLDLDFKSNINNSPYSIKSVDYDSIDDILAKLESSVSQEVILDDSEVPISKVDLEPNEKSPNENPESIVQSEKKVNNDDYLKNVRQLKITNLPGNNKVYNLNLSSTDDGYKIQLSFARSENEAQNEWNRIKARHSKYLKNVELVIKKVKTNAGKILYLVMAGDYSSLNQAKLICKKLTQSKQNCIVTK